MSCLQFKVQQFWCRHHCPTYKLQRMWADGITRWFNISLCLWERRRRERKAAGIDTLIPHKASKSNLNCKKNKKSQGFKVMSVHKVNHMKKISRACLCNTFPRKRWQFFAETQLFLRLVQQESAETCFRHVRFFCRKSGIPIPKRGYRTFSSTEKWTPVYKPCFLCHPQNGMRKKRLETLMKKTNEISMPKLVSISLKSFIVDLHSKSSFSLSTFISTSQSIFNPSLFGNTISITITISNPNLNPTPFQLFNFQTLNSTPKL